MLIIRGYCFRSLPAPSTFCFSTTRRLTFVVSVISNLKVALKTNHYNNTTTRFSNTAFVFCVCTSKFIAILKCVYLQLALVVCELYKMLHFKLVYSVRCLKSAWPSCYSVAVIVARQVIRYSAKIYLAAIWMWPDSCVMTLSTMKKLSIIYNCRQLPNVLVGYLMYSIKFT